MTTAILALQGAFIEHANMFALLDEPTFEIRQKKDMLRSFDRLVLPGGESSVQRKLLHDLDLFNTLQEAIQDDMPVMGTCAGLILLAQVQTEPKNVCDKKAHAYKTTLSFSDIYPGFATLPIAVERNAYGRQLGSFRATAQFSAKDKQAETIPMTFIRAPRITHILDDEVAVLAYHQTTPVAVQYHNQIGIAFHPELDANTCLHRHFLSL